MKSSSDLGNIHAYYKMWGSFHHLRSTRLVAILQDLEDRFHRDRLALILCYALEEMSSLFCFSFLSLTLPQLFSHCTLSLQRHVNQEKLQIIPTFHFSGKPIEHEHLLMPKTGKSSQIKDAYSFLVRHHQNYACPGEYI